MIDTNKKRIQYSRLEGIKSIHSSIFSKRISEEISLGGFQLLISLTENDEVNSLSCIRYSENFDKDKMFRFPLSVADSVTEAKPSVNYGNELMDPSNGYSFLLENQRQGFKFEIITIITDISFTDFVSNKDNMTLILGITKDNIIITAKDRKLLQKGDRWIIQKKKIVT